AVKHDEPDTGSASFRPLDRQHPRADTRVPAVRRTDRRSGPLRGGRHNGRVVKDSPQTLPSRRSQTGIGPIRAAHATTAERARADRRSPNGLALSGAALAAEPAADAPWRHADTPTRSWGRQGRSACLAGDPHESPRSGRRQRVRTILPAVSPSSIFRKASGASVIGSSAPIAGRIPASCTNSNSEASSSRVPMVDPTTRNCRKNTRCSSAFASGPLVDPETTTTPPGLSDFSECDHVALPTVSNTASTRCGNRAPGSNVSCAPSFSASARFASVRPVAYTRMPAARPSWISAVATPPDAPCTSIDWPGRSPDLTNSIRYAVSHAVPITDASAQLSPLGLGIALAAGTMTRSANVPWCFSVSSVRLGSSVSSPRHAGSPITECSTTSVPSGSVPAPSQPRIIGNCSFLIPTPRRVHTSCMFKLAALTSTVTQPSGASGSGRSPVASPANGSSGLGSVAYTANMSHTVSAV